MTRTQRVALARLCRTCAARPALLHESDCFDCYSMKETEREVVRLTRELAAAKRRVSVLEEKVERRALRLRVTETERDRRRRERRNLNFRRWRERHLKERRVYNREWMRAYRARRAA